VYDGTLFLTVAILIGTIHVRGVISEFDVTMKRAKRIS
jgi:hypothetical protein